jgi:hypothetical protein
VPAPFPERAFFCSLHGKGCAKVARFLPMYPNFTVTFSSFDSTIPRISSIDVSKRMRYPMGTEKQLLGCAQLISATKSTRRFQIENEGELDHEKADFPP